MQIFILMFRLGYHQHRNGFGNIRLLYSIYVSPHDKLETYSRCFATSSLMTPATGSSPTLTLYLISSDNGKKQVLTKLKN